MTVLEMMESITYEELKEWTEKRYSKIDLKALENMGFKAPTVDELWECRQQEINAFKRKSKTPRRG